MLARLGRTCYDRRRFVLLGWLLVFLVGAAASPVVSDRLGGERGSSSLESVQGYRVLDDVRQYGPRVVAVVDGLPVTDDRLRTAVAGAHSDLSQTPGVGRVLDPVVDRELAFLVAEDRRALIVAVDLERDLADDEWDRALDAVETRLRAVDDQVPGVTVLVGGQLLLDREINEQTSADTTLGEAVALPATLLVMIVIFGGLVAAGIPFLGALASIAGGLLTLLGFSAVMDLDPSVLSVTTVLGLGLSIDYSLLMVSRYREELASGLDRREAVARTHATAGRTITFSALTVATSLAGLFVFPSTIFRAIGAAGVGVVLVALLVGLTLTPALLGAAGARMRPRAGQDPDDGFFARVARTVQRRALLVTLVVAALLLAAGLPFLGANFQNADAELLPEGFESRRVAELAQERFAAQRVEPVTVVANTDARSLQRWAAGLRDLPEVDEVGRAEQRADGVSVVEILPRRHPRDAYAKDLVRLLRTDEHPPFRTWVTGEAAVLVDFLDEVVTYAPLALLLVALATFVLLFLMTGSVLVPVKALVMNTLSLGASFGALVLIFQDGWLAGVLGFTPNGGLETFVPVIVFAFAFGLSMDYEVFLLARVKELYDGGLDNDRAVQVGLQRSGRIITSAALLVVIVFAGFAAGKMLAVKELGVALAIAVAVDATLVRCLLVPATMTLLGDANWWAPGPLRRLHARVGLQEAGAAPGGARHPPPEAGPVAHGEPAAAAVVSAAGGRSGSVSPRHRRD